jgi:hypothetical protein
VFCSGGDRSRHTKSPQSQSSFAFHCARGRPRTLPRRMDRCSDSVGRLGCGVHKSLVHSPLFTPTILPYYYYVHSRKQWERRQISFRFRVSGSFRPDTLRPGMCAYVRGQAGMTVGRGEETMGQTSGGSSYFQDGSWIFRRSPPPSRTPAQAGVAWVSSSRRGTRLTRADHDTIGHVATTRAGLLSPSRHLRYHSCCGCEANLMRCAGASCRSRQTWERSPRGEARGTSARAHTTG